MPVEQSIVEIISRTDEERLHYNENKIEKRGVMEVYKDHKVAYMFVFIF